MLCGLAIALLEPLDCDPQHRNRSLWAAQIFILNIFWLCWAGVAVGLIVDSILTRPRKSVRFQFTLRSLFLFVALIASALGGWMLYVQIMTMPP